MNKPRAKSRHPEHNLQTQILKLVRACAPSGAVFLAFDRSKAHSQFQHAREKARGIRSGTPDTLLMVLDVPDFWCELKVDDNDTTDSQDEVIDDIRRVGRNAAVAWSVEQYRAAAVAAGIVMSPGAVVMAMRLDALLEGPKAIATKRAAPKPPRERVSPAKMRRVAAIRQKLPF